ncbi:MAG: YceI family protein [Betaproteobacteria bacterium]
MPLLFSRSIAAIFAGATIISAAASTHEVYVLDANHTLPMYQVTHMGLSQQRGTFSGVSGKVVLDRAGRKGSIDVTISTATVTSGLPRMVAILKGEDLFNVEKFPTMTYKSTQLQFDNDRPIGATGELTLLGVSRPVDLTITDFKCGPHPFNKRNMCGGEATATIKRSEFGMKYGIPVAASDEVRIVIPFEGMQQ